MQCVMRTCETTDSTSRCRSPVHLPALLTLRKTAPRAEICKAPETHATHCL